MAEYYALLARAVGALQRNDEASRREIYVKARSALIRQLKAILPPLPPSEISKQRLALEEAIRRVEREAVEAAAASRMSDEDIARHAERALAEALAPDAGPEAAPFEEEAEPVVLREAPRTAPPRPEPPSFEPAAEPEVMAPQPAAKSFAEVVRPQPTARASQRPANWERAATVTDVEEPPPPPPPPPRQAMRERARDPKRGGRGWETAPRHQRRKRSVAARLTLLVLVVILIGVGGYFAYQYQDQISDFVNSAFGNDAAETTDAVAADDAAASAAASGGAAAESTASPAAAVVAEEPVILPDAAAYLYEEPQPSSPASKLDGTINWALGTDPDTGLDVITANIAVPGEGLQIAMRVARSTDPEFSHEISVLVTQDAAHSSDPLASVENLAVKSSEEAIGAELQGTAFNDPDFFLLQLPTSDVILNNNRLGLSPWFDLNLVFASGRRVIVAFSKGQQGTDVFDEALAAWQAN